MRAATQINELALAIQRQVFFRRNAFDDFRLVFFAYAAEEFGRFDTFPNFSLNGLVAVNDVLHTRLDCLEIRIGEGLSASKVVVKAVFDGGSDRYLRIRPQLLHGLCQHVRGIMTQ